MFFNVINFDYLVLWPGNALKYPSSVVQYIPPSLSLSRPVHSLSQRGVTLLTGEGGATYHAAGMISPHTPRGVWGHPPPENFGNLDSQRLFLRHSDSYFGATHLVAILALK